MLPNSFVKDNLGLIESSILHFNVSKKKYNNNNNNILVMDKSSSDHFTLIHVSASFNPTHSFRWMPHSHFHPPLSCM